MASSLEEPVSPELVLVDSDLARRARAELSTPIMSRPITPLAPIGPFAPNAQIDDVAQAAFRRLSSLDVADASDTSRRRVPPSVLIGTLCAVVLTVVIVAGIGDLPRAAPTGGSGSATSVQTPSESAVIAQETEEKQDEAGEQPSQPSRSDSSSPAARVGPVAVIGAKSRTSAPEAERRLTAERPGVRPLPTHVVWPPVATATSYSIELFRGSSLILSAHSRIAHFVLPAAWTAHGRSYRRDSDDRLVIRAVVAGHAKTVVSGRLISDLAAGASSP